MQPSEFWGADTWTVMDAYEGYAISRGVKRQEGRPWTKDDMDELERMMAEDKKRMAARAGKQ